jgi:hypothetical protein
MRPKTTVTVEFERPDSNFDAGALVVGMLTSPKAT